MPNKYRGASFSGGNNANLTVGTGFEPSRPVGAGKGPIRKAMDNDSFKYSSKDRMAARRADKAMAGTANNTPYSPIGTANNTPTSSAPPSNQGATWKTPPQSSAAPRTQWEMDRFQRLKKNDEMRAKGINPTTGRPMGAEPNLPPAATQAPLQGRALADKNIAEKGIQGAAADYFQRRDTEMLAKQQKQTDAAFSKPVDYAGAPAAKMGAGTPSNAAKPAKAAYRNPMTAPAAAAPTMAMGMGSTPKQPASIAPSGAEDYGGDVVMKDAQKKAMITEQAKTAKGRADMSYSDRMSTAGGVISGQDIGNAARKVTDPIKSAAKDVGASISQDAKKVVGQAKAGVAAARSFSDRTNAWTNNFKSRRNSSWKTPPPVTADIGKADVMPNKRMR